jgi:hypothetical protein
VTDNSGATGTVTHTVSVTAAPSNIDFRASAKNQITAASASVTIPTGVQADDAMLLFASFNTLLSTTPTAPAGWTFVARQDAVSMTTVLWQRTASAPDGGTAVTINAGATQKIDLQLLAYSGTEVNAVAHAVSAADVTSTSTHVTPTATVADRASRVVSLWADKSSTTTSWTAPASVVVRSTSIGTGSGWLTSLAADGGSNVDAGSSAGGLAATTNAASAKATMWTVVLKPHQN